MHAEDTNGRVMGIDDGRGDWGWGKGKADAQFSCEDGNAMPVGSANGRARGLRVCTTGSAA
jgi:hypothetical protein